ncbi:MAG: UDP-glucose 4-epimerase GalE [Flavobacteriia bacterium]|jgi:UDP-glucose 4-epimerase
MNKDKPILISGGAGYIGSHTVVELSKAGYYPVIVDDFRNANRTVIAGMAALLGYDPEIAEVDVCDRGSLESIFQKYKFKGIIHFAAYKAVGESVQEPLKYYHNNIGGLVSLCELALKYGVLNFVFSSSCTVYGEPLGLKEVNEDSPKGIPNSPYGNTKLIGEQILIDLQKARADFKVINLRYFNPVGAHPSGLIGEFPLGRPSNLLPFVTQTAMGKHEYLTVFGNDYPTPDGTCIRDYIHVCDLSDAHVKALEYLMETQHPCLEAINIGTGKGTSILEVINLFEERTAQKLNWKYGPRREGDVVEIYANTKKSGNILGWTPKYTVSDAIVHAWEWEKKLSVHA